MNIITPEMAILSLAINAFMTLIGRIKIGGDKAAHRINRSWAWQRFGTLFALAIGVSASIFAAINDSDTNITERCMFGAIAAAFAVTARNVFKDNLFRMLEDKRK